MYRQFGKRLFDLVIASQLVLITFPLFVFIAFIVRLTMGSPILFRQKRPGMHGRIFILIKFRSMTNSVDDRGNALSDSQRISRFGCFLRSTSLDELPELWNVILGDMSLIGPRPLLVEYLDRYTPEQAKRHEAKPGITGWAQINGRNAINWEEKFKLDLWYVQHLSLWLDIKIFTTTLLRVLKRDGINQAGQATAEKFAGSEK